VFYLVLCNLLHSLGFVPNKGKILNSAKMAIGLVFDKIECITIEKVF